MHIGAIYLKLRQAFIELFTQMFMSATSAIYSADMLANSYPYVCKLL